MLSFDKAGHVMSTGTSSVIGPVAPAAVAVAVYEPARKARTCPSLNATACRGPPTRTTASGMIFPAAS